LNELHKIYSSNISFNLQLEILGQHFTYFRHSMGLVEKMIYKYLDMFMWFCA
jgi:hypothetical protein